MLPFKCLEVWYNFSYFQKKRLLCSPQLLVTFLLFKKEKKKNGKNSNIVKYYYNFKGLFSILFYFIFNVMYSCSLAHYSRWKHLSFV